MPKDFDTWNEYKKIINNERRPVNFHEREIWWCKIGVNIGSEQDSYSGDFSRPILVLKKFTQTIFLGVPFTTTISEEQFRFHYVLRGRKTDLLLLHVRSFDSRRLGKKIGVMSVTDFNTVVGCVCSLLINVTDPTIVGSLEAEANVVKIRTSSRTYSIENQRILSNFFGDRYFPRLTISSRM
ncbi:MAG: type II toxin-antitoxin system PemK/MazF family toxin [Patescibacteria group bacterium]